MSERAVVADLDLLREAVHSEKKSVQTLGNMRWPCENLLVVAEVAQDGGHAAELRELVRARDKVEDAVDVVHLFHDFQAHV